MGTSAQIRNTRNEYYLRVRGQFPDSMPSVVSPVSATESATESALDPDAVITAIRAMQDSTSQALPAALPPQSVLLRYAPTALSLGCWLWQSVQVKQTHTALGGALVDAFFFMCGEGDFAQHPASQYRGLLSSVSVCLPPLSSRAFVEDPRLCDADFALPLFGLFVGNQPASALPDVLGIHAAMMLWGPPPAVCQAMKKCASASQLQSWEQNTDRQDRALALIRKTLTLYAEAGNPNWPRVLAVAAKLRDLRSAFVDALVPSAPPTAWENMLALVQRKFRHGFGFHRHVHLAGRSLDRFFDPQKPDLQGFLIALSRSHFVTPGRPEQSLILRRTTQFGGTMFGIFDDQELAVLSSWIAALPDSAVPEIATPQATQDHGLDERDNEGTATKTETAWETLGGSPFGGTGPLPSLDLPSLYHHLLADAGDPAWTACAKTYLAERITEVAKAGSVDRLTEQKLWPYSASRLADWVDSQLRQQVLGNPDVGGKTEPQEDMGIERHLHKSEVLWLLTQLAPAALIDGAWLQGITTPLFSAQIVTPLLFQIYRDELGAGVPQQHHGNLMRSVLVAEGIVLPDCDSLDFVRYPGFLPASFSTPVLWLAISRCTDSFFPELLGLNLAIELAGVGKGYDRATALLRKHGIDPYFFVLHNTIDNGASGHTAWSVRAIVLYLEQLCATADQEAVATCWQRIFRGYALYAKSSLPLLSAIGMRMGPRLGMRWLWRFLTGKTAAESS